MNTFDSAQMVLSSIASTWIKHYKSALSFSKTVILNMRNYRRIFRITHICTWSFPLMWFLYSKASHFSELWCSGLFIRGTCLSLNTTKDCRRFVSLSAASVDKYITGALAFSTIRRMHSAAWGMGKKQLSFFTLLQEHQEKISQYPTRILSTGLTAMHRPQRLN